MSAQHRGVEASKKEDKKKEMRNGYSESQGEIPQVVAQFYYEQCVLRRSASIRIHMIQLHIIVLQ